MAKSKQELTQQQADKKEAIKDLRKKLRRGTTLYAVTIAVRRSSGIIKIVRVSRGKIEDLSGPIANVLGREWDGRGAIVVHGLGLNREFHTVFQLGEALYKDGYALEYKGL